MYAWEWSCLFGAVKVGFTIEWAATYTRKGKKSYPGSSRSYPGNRKSYPNGRNYSRQGNKSHWEGEKVSSFLCSSQGDSNESFRAIEKCRIALILSWFLFFFKIFWLCCFHILAQVRMLEWWDWVCLMGCNISWSSIVIEVWKNFAVGVGVIELWSHLII